MSEAGGDDGDVRLMLGDCLERMAEVADGSVDLILADLPYGTMERRAKISRWDRIIPFGPLWVHYRRVLKSRGAVVLTARQPFTSMLVMSQPDWFRDEWIWEKGSGTGFLSAKTRPLRCHESVLVFGPRLPKYNPQMKPARPRMNGGHGGVTGSLRVKDRLSAKANGCVNYPRSVLYFPRDQHTVHPTQKPVALFEYLVRTYSDPGDLILDNACGSATTLIAAMNTDRRAIGIERDPTYFATASDRIAAHRASTPLLA